MIGYSYLPLAGAGPGRGMVTFGLWGGDPATGAVVIVCFDGVVVNAGVLGKVLTAPAVTGDVESPGASGDVLGFPGVSGEVSLGPLVGGPVRGRC